MIPRKKLSPQKVSHQFVPAFEGGSNYWLQQAGLVRSDSRPTDEPWVSEPCGIWKGV